MLFLLVTFLFLATLLERSQTLSLQSCPRFLYHGRSGTFLRASDDFIDDFLGVSDEAPPAAIARKIRAKRREMMETIRAATAVQAKKELPTSLLNDPLLPAVTTIVTAASDRKVVEMEALRVAAWTDITSFVVVIEASNRPQIEAVAAHIEVSFSMQARH